MELVYEYTFLLNFYMNLYINIFLLNVLYEVDF